MSFPASSSTSLCSPQPPSVMCTCLCEQQLWPFLHPLSDWGRLRARWRSPKYSWLLILPTTTTCFRVVLGYMYGQISWFKFLMSKWKFTGIQPILMIRLFMSIILLWYERRVFFLSQIAVTFLAQIVICFTTKIVTVVSFLEWVFYSLLLLSSWIGEWRFFERTAVQLHP